ncbi:ras association domain-containing protein 3 isoform X1 [Lates japonicus]|uniref:Ras association domain-containing protein 3 isoform X1 n=1 Tax=Lates japonicus TaxID=270547 RepID=A0AAD3M6V3_LATJO|nr:ras association domain-containing protein 3 isoform X1 [Lates japonicus]
MHQGRKYVPTRSSVTDDSPLTVQALHINKSPGTLREAPEATWPPHGAKMRISKANKGAVVVRAVRRHPSPQPASLESLEAAWSQRGQPEVKPPESLPSPERRNGEGEAAEGGLEGHGGGPPRSRKKGFRPPDVRTIFSPEERDPRVKEESGEGHTFEPGGEDTWCDACCQYIFQHGLTCSAQDNPKIIDPLFTLFTDTEETEKTHLEREEIQDKTRRLREKERQEVMKMREEEQRTKKSFQMKNKLLEVKYIVLHAL